MTEINNSSLNNDQIEIIDVDDFDYEGFQVVVWLKREYAKQSVMLPESRLTYFSLS